MTEQVDFVVPIRGELVQPNRRHLVEVGVGDPSIAFAMAGGSLP